MKILYEIFLEEKYCVGGNCNGLMDLSSRYFGDVYSVFNTPNSLDRRFFKCRSDSGKIFPSQMDFLRTGLK